MLAESVRIPACQPVRDVDSTPRSLRIIDNKETLIFYESVHRIQSSVEDMINVFGGTRQAVLCKEITKMHESFIGETLSDISQFLTENKEKIKEHRRKYRQENSEKVKERVKKYRRENPEKIRAYLNKRYKNDENFRMIAILRARLRKSLNSQSSKKSKRTLELVGCSIRDIRQHLENQFKDGMSWENQGEWHIDHIKPCSLFDLTDPEQQKECFNYKNLQPLWAIDNIKKSNKWQAPEALPNF